MAAILSLPRNLRILLPHQLNVLCHLVRLHMVELDGMHIFPPSEHLPIALLHLTLLLLSLLGSVQDTLYDAALLVVVVVVVASGTGGSKRLGLSILFVGTELLSEIRYSCFEVGGGLFAVCYAGEAGDLCGLQEGGGAEGASDGGSDACPGERAGKLA